MELGTCSLSLSVEEVGRSRTIHEALGPEAVGGDPGDGYGWRRPGWG